MTPAIGGGSFQHLNRYELVYELFPELRERGGQRAGTLSGGLSLSNFVGAARGAVERSGARLEDVTYLCGIHMKRSMHDAIVDALGIDPARVSYLDDTGHMSGVDPLLGLDRAVRAGDVGDGDLVVLLAAGTGYTWAATVLRWGAAE